MNQFADGEFVQVPLAQITWYHHISMFPKVKDNILRSFYITESALQGLIKMEEKRQKSHFFQTSATKWRSLRVLLQKNSILYGRQ